MDFDKIFKGGKGGGRDIGIKKTVPYMGCGGGKYNSRPSGRVEDGHQGHSGKQLGGAKKHNGGETAETEKSLAVKEPAAENKQSEFDLGESQ